MTGHLTSASPTATLTGPMEPYLKVLDPPLEPVSVEIPDVQLIVLERDTHLYQWQTRAAVSLR